MKGQISQWFCYRSRVVGLCLHPTQLISSTIQANIQTLFLHTGGPCWTLAHVEAVLEEAVRALTAPRAPMARWVASRLQGNILVGMERLCTSLGTCDVMTGIEINCKASGSRIGYWGLRKRRMKARIYFPRKLGQIIIPGTPVPSL